MGDALLDLEQVLSKQTKVTYEEANVLRGCKSRAYRQFTIAALVGGGGVWAATWKFSKLHRLTLSGGAAVISGLWGLRRSRDSCVDDVLSLDGSRMQKELATMMMQRLSKHFYSEEVYDDTSAAAKIRWRYRNFFSDDVTHGQSTPDTDPEESSGDQRQNPPTDSQTVSNKIESSRTDLESRLVTVTSGDDLVADPLDCILGSAAEAAEPVAASKGSKVDGRRQRRSRRTVKMVQTILQLELPNY